MKKWSLLLLLWPLAVFAQDTRPLSAEVLWELHRIGSPVISPTGGHVVAPVTTYDTSDDSAQTRLYLFSENGGVQRPLTAEGHSAGNPVFSPDGSWLAFVSRRNDDDAGQIYLLPMNEPGEAKRLGHIPTGVSSLRWVGEHIYFISRIYPGQNWEEMSKTIKAEKDSHVSAHQWNALPYSMWDHWIDEARQAQVFRIHVGTEKVESITEGFGIELPRSSQGLGSYDIHPDETHIAFTSPANPGDVDPNIDLFLARIGGDRATNITEGNAGGDGEPMFSPNGETLAYVRQAIPGFYADNANIVLVDLKTQAQTEITTGWDRSAGGLVWLPDSSGFIGAIADEAHVRIYHIGLDGTPKAITGGTSFGGLSISNEGAVVAHNQSFLYPPRLVRVDLANGETMRLDTINDDVLANVEMGTYESVTYKGYNGQDIQMWVHYPPGFDPKKEYPLFLLIHGGPHNAIPDGFHFRWNAQTFASWGYVTAWHNFHGSNSFGQDFADEINPDWITAPYTDTIAAAKWFEQQDWIDEDRMVAGGGSYGGYLSSILLGKEHPFNALLIHAPVYNMYSQMAADFAVHGTRFGQFWESPEIYKEISPHYYAENFNTPALIIHGQNDLRVPVGQAFELFRTLQTKGIESRLIYYPDENHWVLKPNNSLYWYQEVQSWMAKFAEPGAR